MARGIICHSCGVEAPSKYVEFYQNIGLLVMRMQKSACGYMCKRCVSKHFWSFTGINLTLGWWGIVSLIVTPFFVLNNIIRYLTCLGLEPVPPNAMSPQLTDDAVRKLEPHIPEIVQRLNRNEPLETIATSIARLAGVTPGQVVLIVAALAQNAAQQPAA